LLQCGRWRLPALGWCVTVGRCLSLPPCPCTLILGFVACCPCYPRLVLRSFAALRLRALSLGLLIAIRASALCHTFTAWPGEWRRPTRPCCCAALLRCCQLRDGRSHTWSHAPQLFLRAFAAAAWIAHQHFWRWLSRAWSGFAPWISRHLGLLGACDGTHAVTSYNHHPAQPLPAPAPPLCGAHCVRACRTLAVPKAWLCHPAGVPPSACAGVASWAALPQRSPPMAALACVSGHLASTRHPGLYQHLFTLAVQLLRVGSVCWSLGLFASWQFERQRLRVYCTSALFCASGSGRRRPGSLGPARLCFHGIVSGPASLLSAVSSGLCLWGSSPGGWC